MSQCKIARASNESAAVSELVDSFDRSIQSTHSRTWSAQSPTGSASAYPRVWRRCQSANKWKPRIQQLGAPGSSAPAQPPSPASWLSQSDMYTYASLAESAGADRNNGCRCPVVGDEIVGWKYNSGPKTGLLAQPSDAEFAGGLYSVGWWSPEIHRRLISMPAAMSAVHIGRRL